MIYTEIHYFLGDRLRASPTFEQHLVTLRKMFKRLRKAKLMLGHKKCSFATSPTEFLGHNLSSSGISPSVDQLRAVKIPYNQRLPNRLKALLVYPLSTDVLFWVSHK